MVSIMGFAFIAVGAIISAFLVSKLFKAIQSHQWPYAWGQIDNASTRDVVVQSPGERVGGHKSTQVDYTYTYEVNDQKYSGQRVTFSDQMVKTAGSLDKLLRDYSDGQQVKVYYNPADPAFSVLKPGPTVYNFTPFITAFLFLGVGIWLAFFATF